MYKVFKTTELDISKEDIQRLKLFNVFVFSLPRSGSSMMCGILERLGVNIIATSDTEDKLAKRNENERKRYGDSYQMNKDGFFEIADNKWDCFHEIMATPYSGCKLIIPVRPLQMGMVTYNPKPKVIMMWRDPEEMRQSQQASYKGNEGITEEQAELQREFIITHLVEQKIRLERLGIDTLHVQYQDVLKDTETQIKIIAKFINAPNSVEDAVSWVEPSKNRFKKEELTENI